MNHCGGSHRATLDGEAAVFGGWTWSHHDDADDAGVPLWQTGKAPFVAIPGVLIAGAFAVSYFKPSVERWTYTVVVLLGLIPFARRAFTLARLRSPFSIETLIVVAALGALVIGATAQAAIVIFLFAIGKLLENVAARRARSGIRALVALMPRTALVEQANGTKEVQASA
jgi:Cd2+/Zn2+-exporting ATPase